MKNNVILENNSIIGVTDRKLENLYIINRKDNSLRKVVDFREILSQERILKWNRQYQEALFQSLESNFFEIKNVWNDNYIIAYNKDLESYIKIELI